MLGKVQCKVVLQTRRPNFFVCNTVVAEHSHSLTMSCCNVLQCNAMHAMQRNVIRV